jgi:hypothetical protein
MHAMTGAPLVVFAAAAAISFSLATPARADDRVQVCIDASTQGQTLRQQGHLLSARDQMIACANDACPKIVRSHCARWLGELDDRIPSVIVRAQDASGTDLVDAHVLIDGKVVKIDGRAIPLDPGEHVVSLDSGAAHKEEHVILIEGEASRLVEMRLGAPASATKPVDLPPPAATSTRVPTAAWILGGVGLVALGGATYFGFAAKGQLDDLNTSCTPHCVDSQTQTGRHDALAFDVLAGVGGVAIGAALVWALAFPTNVEIEPVSRGALAAWTLRY